MGPPEQGGQCASSSLRDDAKNVLASLYGLENRPYGRGGQWRTALSGLECYFVNGFPLLSCMSSWVVSCRRGVGSTGPREGSVCHRLITDISRRGGPQTRPPPQARFVSLRFAAFTCLPPCPR